jgi:hypothetical protein
MLSIYVSRVILCDSRTNPSATAAKPLLLINEYLQLQGEPLWLLDQHHNTRIINKVSIGESLEPLADALRLHGEHPWLKGDSLWFMSVPLWFQDNSLWFHGDLWFKSGPLGFHGDFSVLPRWYLTQGRSSVIPPRKSRVILCDSKDLLWFQSGLLWFLGDPLRLQSDPRWI